MAQQGLPGWGFLATHYPLGWPLLGTSSPESVCCSANWVPNRCYVRELHETGRELRCLEQCQSCVQWLLFYQPWLGPGQVLAPLWASSSSSTTWEV